VITSVDSFPPSGLTLQCSCKLTVTPWVYVTYHSYLFGHASGVHEIKFGCTSVLMRFIRSRLGCICDSFGHALGVHTIHSVSPWVYIRYMLGRRCTTACIRYSCWARGCRLREIFMLGVSELLFWKRRGGCSLHTYMYIISRRILSAGGFQGAWLVTSIRSRYILLYLVFHSFEPLKSIIRRSLTRYRSC